MLDLQCMAMLDLQCMAPALSGLKLQVFPGSCMAPAWRCRRGPWHGKACTAHQAACWNRLLPGRQAAAHGPSWAGGSRQAWVQTSTAVCYCRTDLLQPGMAKQCFGRQSPQRILAEALAQQVLQLCGAGALSRERHIILHDLQQRSG